MKAGKTPLLCPSAKPSQKQGQALAYIYYYTKVNRRPPAARAPRLISVRHGRQRIR